VIDRIRQAALAAYNVVRSRKGKASRAQLAAASRAMGLLALHLTRDDRTRDWLIAGLAGGGIIRPGERVWVFRPDLVTDGRADDDGNVLDPDADPVLLALHEACDAMLDPRESPVPEVLRTPSAAPNTTRYEHIMEEDAASPN